MFLGILVRRMARLPKLFIMNRVVVSGNYASHLEGINKRCWSVLHEKKQASEKEARSDSLPRASLDLESCTKSLHGLSESERSFDNHTGEVGG